MKNINIKTVGVVLITILSLSSLRAQDLVQDTLKGMDLELSLKDSTLMTVEGGQDSIKLTARELRELKKTEKERLKEERRSMIAGEVISADTLAMIDSLLYMDIAPDEVTDEGEGQVPTLESAWKPVLVNHSLGIRGGWGTGMMRREPAREGFGYPSPLWNLSLAYKFDVPEQKYLGTISFELGYMQKGFAYLLRYGGDEVYTRQFDVVELPILWQPYLPLGGGSRFFLSAGPFLSYTLSSWERQYNKSTDEVYFDREYKMDPMVDYMWNYGITAGAGVSIAIQRWMIVVEGRYTIQLSDIMRGPEFVEYAPFRSPVDHIGATIGVFYEFSIGEERQKQKTLERLRNLNILN